MGIIANKSNIDTVIYNGTEIEKVIYNGVVVWKKAPAMYDYSSFGTFVGLYGTTHFLFRQGTADVINVVNISTFKNEADFGYKYHSSNEFEAIKSGTLYCNQYGGDYSANELAGWEINCIRNANSTPETTINFPIKGNTANKIEQDFMLKDGLDFDTLWGDMHAINYTTNKLVVKMRADYYVQKDTGADNWADYYRTVYIIEIPIVNESTLNFNAGKIIKEFNKDYTIEEPGSYEDFNSEYYYNTYTQDLYRICSREDNDGDTAEFFKINSATNTAWGGLPVTQIPVSNIIKGAEFSFKGIDATLSVPYAALKGTLDIYVFNSNELVKSTLTDSDLCTGTTENIVVKYNGEDVYIANTTKKIIKKLKFNESTFVVTL